MAAGDVEYSALGRTAIAPREDQVEVYVVIVRAHLPLMLAHPVPPFPALRRAMSRAT